MPARSRLLPLCYHAVVESNGNGRPQDSEKAVLMLRVPSPLKGRLADYAKVRGLTLNAAAIVLLGDALSQTDRP